MIAAGNHGGDESARLALSSAYVWFSEFIEESHNSHQFDRNKLLAFLSDIDQGKYGNIDEPLAYTLALGRQLLQDSEACEQALAVLDNSSSLFFKTLAGRVRHSPIIEPERFLPERIQYDKDYEGPFWNSIVFLLRMHDHAIDRFHVAPQVAEVAIQLIKLHRLIPGKPRLDLIARVEALRREQNKPI